MTHHNDYTLTEKLLEELLTNGMDSLPELLRIIVNTAMQAERAKYIQADAYERSENRQGHANGYKPKTVKTRIGEVTFAVPQVREGGFYPSSLEKGLRSERALTMSLAEMYVQGVSTRKVKAIAEELSGVEVTATQVSRAAAQLDEVLQQWRKWPLGEITSLYLDARYEKMRKAGQVLDTCTCTLLQVQMQVRPQRPGGCPESSIRQCGMAEMPVPPAAERRRLCAQAGHANQGGRRYTVHVEFPRW